MDNADRRSPLSYLGQRVRVTSVNVGVPRTVRWRGREITTGIFKEPVGVAYRSAA